MNEYKTDNKPPTWQMKKRGWFDGKTKEVLIISVLAFVLIFATWKIFYTEDKTVSQTNVSEAEAKISRLLTDMQGVGDASVIICETEEGVQSAVVVCEGASNLQVILNVREAVAAALGTNQSAVKVYLKKV